MGYYYSHYTFSKVDEPKQISLSGNPNFVTFSNASDSGEDKPARMRIKIIYNDSQSTEQKKYKIHITITEQQTGTEHTFTGIYDEDDMSDKSFLLGEEKKNPLLPQGKFFRVEETIYNLRECLLKDDFIRNNFEVSIVSYLYTDNIGKDKFRIGDTIELVSKAAGKQYDCNISVQYKLDNSSENKTFPDIRLTLGNINYNWMTEQDKSFSWCYSYKDGLRPAMGAEIKGSLTADESAFLIVKPETGIYTEAEAHLQTLRNLYNHLLLREPVVGYAHIELNEENRSIDFYMLADNDIYSFDKIENKGKWFQFEYFDMWYKFLYSCTNSVKNDSFDSGTGAYRIDLDVYTDTGLFLGCPDDNDNIKGKYLTTLSKSYFGQPLWFDLNTLQDKRKKYSTRFLSEFDGANPPVWVDAGTVSDYRFMAKRTDGVDTFPFYYSNVLYILNGYSYTLDDTKLSGDNAHAGYILDRSVDIHDETFRPIVPLTTNTQRIHIKGQTQYFNFILKDEKHNPASTSKSYNLALEYRMYTQSGLYIGKELGRETDYNRLSIVNTSRLDLDKYLPEYKGKTVGRIEVRLVSWYINDEENTYIPQAVVSEPMVFCILPEQFHTVNDFAFLNRLGGWDSFNFGEKKSLDFKTTASTVYKTLQPSFNVSTEIESVAAKTVQEQYIAQSSLISRSAAQWLKELSASQAVFELSTRRYVIVDELNLKCNSSDDFYQVDMKYRYSDTFNGRIK